MMKCQVRLKALTTSPLRPPVHSLRVHSSFLVQENLGLFREGRVRLQARAEADRPGNKYLFRHPCMS